MLKIGITGGMGSGKTTIAHFFEKLLAIPVYYSDVASKRLLNEDPELKKKIKLRFGADIYDESGKLNRKALADMVFNNDGELAALNQLTHPKVEEDFYKWCESHHDSPYILKEAALLFESGTYKNLDLIYTVSADENIRIQRVIQRDKVTELEVMARMAKQMREDERIAMANGVIYNNENEMLIPQLLYLHGEWLTQKKSVTKMLRFLYIVGNN